MRPTNNSSACCTNRNEFMFLSSARVPYSLDPSGMREMFASQRKLPSSMLQSLTPANSRTSFTARQYAMASSGDRKSGSPTISMSGTQERL